MSAASSFSPAACWTQLGGVFLSEQQPLDVVGTGLLPAGAVSYFPCGVWLGVTDAAGARGTTAAPLELPAEAEAPRNKTRQYNVSTGQQQGLTGVARPVMDSCSLITGVSRLLSHFFVVVAAAAALLLRL